MKPYGMTTHNYGNTGCCPGHDDPRIRKWSGTYKSAAHKKTNSKITKLQNRCRRRSEKREVNKQVFG